MAEVINTNVFDAEKKFVDFAGLDYFWEKAKAYVDGADKVTADKVAALEGVVGDDASGLVQKVNLLQGELDGLNGGAGSITTQITNALAGLDVEDAAVDGQYVSSVAEVDGKVVVSRAALPVYEEVGVAAGAAAQALADAKAYVDGIVNDVTGEDGAVTKGLNSRIADLEAIDHDKLAADASAAAVATVLDGAPEKFDTLKEIAAWIADADTAEDAASLVTRVKALEDIDHDAYVAADTKVLEDANAYADGLVMVDGVAKFDAAGAAATAKSEAIAKAAEDAAKMLESYYTKTEVDGLVAGAKTYADGLKTAIDGVIDENERVTAEALTGLDTRVKAIEAQDVYVKTDVDAAIADAKKAGTDAAGALDAYKSEAAQAFADNSEADQAYAKAYTDLLFTSFQFADTDDIDALFAPKAE